MPARFFPAARLLEETERLSTRSELVFRETGCWGVAEGAAWRPWAPDGRLLVPKQKGERVTCAVAIAPGDLDPAKIGRPQGRLAVVGLGPGGPGLADGRGGAAAWPKPRSWWATASIST